MIIFIIQKVKMKMKRKWFHMQNTEKNVTSQSQGDNFGGISVILSMISREV
jgi:hypothetical protein